MWGAGGKASDARQRQKTMEVHSVCREENTKPTWAETNQEEDQMTAFKIDKSVPIPAKRKGRSKYPFATMEVGDSFLVDAASRIKTVSALAVYKKKAHPKQKFTVRRVEDGVRVWRIK